MKIFFMCGRLDGLFHLFNHNDLINMKKTVKLLSGLFLLTAVGAVFAADPVACPNASTIRAQGTTLSKGFMNTEVKDYLWYFYSVPFSSEDTNDMIWQTYLEENLPGITDPSTALAKAQNDLNSLALMNRGDSYITEDGVTVCSYHPSNTNYRVFALNTVDVSFKSLRK